MVLESNRVRLLNDQALRREGEKMVEVAQRKLLTSTELRLKWEACFDGESIQENKVTVNLKSAHLELFDKNTNAIIYSITVHLPVLTSI